MNGAESLHMSRERLLTIIFLIIGKMTDSFHCIKLSRSKTSGRSEKKKSYGWCFLPYHLEEYVAITGQSMSAGASTGGFLAATNTPLYVSRQETSKYNWALG